MIAIQLNGEERTVASATVEELLKELQLYGKKVAVELNRRIVHRESYQLTPLIAGDSVEIVNFVGGG